MKKAIQMSAEEMIKAHNRKILWVLIPITVIVIILTIIVVIMVNKAGGKTPVSAEEFVKAARKNNLLAQDVKSGIEKTEVFEDAYIVKFDDNNAVYFFELDNKANAKSYFASVARDLKEKLKYAGTINKTEKNLENYSYYIATTDKKYMHVVRVKNTVVFADVDKAYKRTVEKLIKDIGY